MISFLKKLEPNKLKAKSYPSSRAKLTTGHGKLNGGMTYVELIVVLSIFSIMTSILLFDYNKFEAKVDIKVLANEIASKIVEAQKSAISGKWNVNAPLSWKPSYGIYFDLSSNKNFIYFADLIQNNSYDSSSCSGTGECSDNISITKNNYVSRIDSYLGSTPTPIANPLSITFKRPNSSAIFSSNGILLTGFNYIQITISSPELISSTIKIYPSGRIQIN